MAIPESSKEDVVTSNPDHYGDFWRPNSFNQRNSGRAIYLHDFLTLPLRV